MITALQINYQQQHIVLVDSTQYNDYAPQRNDSNSLSSFWSIPQINGRDQTVLVVLQFGLKKIKQSSFTK